MGQSASHIDREEFSDTLKKLQDGGTGGGRKAFFSLLEASTDTEALTELVSLQEVCFKVIKLLSDARRSEGKERKNPHLSLRLLHYVIIAPIY